MPATAPAQYTRAFANDFTALYPVGSFAVGASGSANDGRILSTSAAYADYGSALNLYPDGGTYPNTPANCQYVTSRTISTKSVDGANGALCMRMFTEGGIAKSGWLRPITTADQLGSDGQTQYVSYGHSSARMRVVGTNNSDNFGGVMLFIPNNWPQGGEIDGPEGQFNQQIGGFFHWKDAAATSGTSGSFQTPWTASPTAYWDTWHTFDTYWQPGRLRHMVDGVTVFDTTAQGLTAKVPTDLMKMIWQCGAHSNVQPNASADAEWQIDWITFDTWTG